MPKLVVVDTSCLIALTRIDSLELIYEVYDRVNITDIIRREYKLDLPDWIKVRDIAPSDRMKVMQTMIDPGEASAIDFCLQNTGSLLIIDDAKGRNVAKKLGVRVSGTLALLVKAKQKGAIQKVSPYLAALEKAEFRFDKKLKEIILRSAGEL